MRQQLDLQSDPLFEHPQTVRLQWPQCPPWPLPKLFLHMPIQHLDTLFKLHLFQANQ